MFRFIKQRKTKKRNPCVRLRNSIIFHLNSKQATGSSTMNSPNELRPAGSQTAHTVVGIENQSKHMSERSLVKDSTVTVKRFSPLLHQVSYY